MSDSVDTSTRLAIAQVMANYAMGLDMNDWPLLRSCFCDEIKLDYGEKSAETGGPDEWQSADNWVEILKSSITRFDMTHHQLEVYRVSDILADKPGQQMQCLAYLVAEHMLYADPAMPIATDESEYITLGGYYTNDFVQEKEQWKIQTSKLTATWLRGNYTLFDPNTPRPTKKA